MKKYIAAFSLLSTNFSAYAVQQFSDLMPSFQARDGYHSGNKELQIYDRALANHNGTSFVLNLKKQNTPNCDKNFNCEYKSGWIDTYGKWSTKTASKGMIVIEASVNPTQGVDPEGLWPAIWMLPNSLPPLSLEKTAQYSWPLNGEIDIMEGRGSNLNEIASTIHYGLDGSTKHAYNGSIYKCQAVRISDRIQYALSWNFENKNNPPQISWNVKLPNQKSWKNLKNMDLSTLARSDNIAGTCPKLGLNYPERTNIPMKECLLNVFNAGQESGYYLIVNLAVGGYYDGNPSQNKDLSGSQMTVYSARYYPNVTVPGSL